MHRPARWLFLAWAAGSLALGGCATPEELAAAAQKRQGEKQTGTNISRSSSARVSGTGDQSSSETLLNDMRNVPAQSAMPAGSGR
jgi:hypothetical protein